MAGCLNFVEEGNVSPENVKRWTERLLNVLLSSTARQRFYDFLEAKDFEEGQKLLEFWIKCDQFLGKAEKLQNQERKPYLKEGTCSSGVGTPGTRQNNSKLLLEEANEIVSFAEMEIDFDAEMCVLYKAVQSEDANEIVKAISDVKQIAAEKLENAGYEEFCKHLLKKQGLSVSGK